MIAPKSAIALAAASFPWSEGTNMPDNFCRWPQVAPLSEEAGRHDKHESGYNEFQFAGPKSLHPKGQEGAEYCEDNSSPHWNLEQYIECKGCAQR